MGDKLDLFANELSYFKDVANIYKSIPYHKGLKSALLEYNTFYKSSKFTDEKYNKNDISTRFTQYKKKKHKSFKKAHEDVLKDRKTVKL